MFSAHWLAGQAIPLVEKMHPRSWECLYCSDICQCSRNLLLETYPQRETIRGKGVSE